MKKPSTIYANFMALNEEIDALRAACRAALDWYEREKHGGGHPAWIQQMGAALMPRKATPVPKKKK